MGRSSVKSSQKPLMVFTRTDPGSSVEGCLNAITANLYLIKGPEPNPALHHFTKIDSLDVQH